MFLHFLILGIQRYIRKLTTQAELKQENYKCNDTFPNGFHPLVLYPGFSTPTFDEMLKI